MKTTSKFLSMLLLVAMCLSLMGGSAYALELSSPVDGAMTLDLPLSDAAEAPTADVPTADVPTANDSDNNPLSLPADEPGTQSTDPANLELQGANGLTLDGIMPLAALDMIWNGNYTDLQTAVNKESSVWLHADAGKDTGNVVSDMGGTINKPVVIDLKGKTLDLTGALAINANVTIKNGTIQNASLITVAKGYTLTLEGVNTNGTNVGGEGKVNTSEAYVATIGSYTFPTVDDALQYAAGQGGTVTINFVNDPSKLEDLTVTAWPATMSCSAVILNLNNNCITGNITTSVPVTINGGQVKGTITASTHNLTLNNTQAENVTAIGTTLTVSNSTVNKVELQGATLSMAYGNIKALVVNDGAAGQSTLNVSGGYVNFTSATGNAKRAVTGGEWTVADDTVLAYLNAAVAQNMHLDGIKNPYTVGKGSGDINNPVTGDFQVVGSPYTQYSSSAVYVIMPYTSSTGNYYWSSVRNPSQTSQIAAISGCTVENYGGQFKLNVPNTFLDNVKTNTVYLWTGHDGKYAYMGAVQINGSNIVPSGAYIRAVDDSVWYSGDGDKTFEYSPASDGPIYIDGQLIGGDQWRNNTYYNILQLPTSLLSNLKSGQHTLTLTTTAGNVSCYFSIGATLKPVDTDKHVIGSSKNLKFVCSEPIYRVWINGNELTNSYYGDYFSLSSTRKTITLNAKFLNERTAGETYTITVQTDSGSRPSSSFQILTKAQASSSPRTGDESNLALWAAVLIVSGGAAVAVLPRAKKHEN